MKNLPALLQQEFNETIALAVPLVASQLIYSCSGFLGTAFIAQLGEDALAASVLVVIIWVALSVLFFGLLNSISVLVAYQYGAKNPAAISTIMGQSYWLGLLVSALIILLLYLTPALLPYTHQPSHVITLAIDYLHAIMWQIPSLVLLIIYEQFLAGISRTRMVLVISLLVVPIEVPIIYVLIFGKFGLPAFGIAGVGYGFAITYTVTAFVMTLYFIKSKYYKQFNLFTYQTLFDFQCLKELVRIGLPMGFMHVIEISAFAVMTFWIAQFGTIELAAHQVALQFFWFFITIAFALSQAITIRVGQCLGQNEVILLKYAILVMLFLNFISNLPILLGFMFMPNLLLQLDFNVNDPGNAVLLQKSKALLMICGLFIFIESYRLIMFGILRGLKNTRYPMYVSLFSFCGIGLASGYCLGFTFNLQDDGIWWGMTLGITFAAVLLVWRVKNMLNLFRTEV